MEENVKEQSSIHLFRVTGNLSQGAHRSIYTRNMVIMKIGEKKKGLDLTTAPELTCYVKV